MVLLAMWRPAGTVDVIRSIFRVVTCRGVISTMSYGWWTYCSIFVMRHPGLSRTGARTRSSRWRVLCEPAVASCYLLWWGYLGRGIVLDGQGINLPFSEERANSYLG